MEAQSLLRGRDRRVSKSNDLISSEEKERSLQGLGAELKEHEGEFVLVVDRNEYFPRSHDDSWSEMRTSFHLGIISPPFLDMKTADGLLEIGTESGHVLAREGRSSASLLRGNLGPMTPLIHTERFGEKINGFPALEIAIGDKAVTTWFSNYAEWHRIDENGDRPAIEGLKDSDSEGYARWKARHFDKDTLLTFLIMQRALGREIKMASESAQQELKEVTEQEKLDILKRIRINRLSQQRYDILRVKEDIHMALELGMHITPWVIGEQVRRGEKIVVDVPELIHGYCEEYGIEVPQTF